MKKNRKRFSGVIWIAIWLLLTNGGGLIESVISTGASAVSEDTSMQTRQFQTDIVVNDDQTYDVTENISVTFLDSRHGIYRYLPLSGTSRFYDADHNLNEIPYHAQIALTSANVSTNTSTENGNEVIRLGDEYNTLYGDQEYQISYKVTPKFQVKAFDNAYYNVFPMQWQNAIPAGSSFTITFPKEFDHERLSFYSGTYGESNNAENILSLNWTGDTVTGVLNQDLALGEGVTFSANMETGYFTSVHQVFPYNILFTVIAGICLVIVLILFFLFGKDEPIISSIQYQPPEGLDSASVGYIIDGSIEDKDLISLIVYWADHGYISIEEKEENELTLHQLKQLTPEAPNYQKTLFDKIFEKGNVRSITSLQYKFEGTMEIAKSQLKYYLAKDGKNGIYTQSSQIARVVSFLLAMIPLACFMLISSLVSYTSTARIVLQVILWGGLIVGLFVFCNAVDTWYAKSKSSRKMTALTAGLICFLSTGIYVSSYVSRVLDKEIFDFLPGLGAVIIATIVTVIATAFMKKRTPECTEWMGRLAGLRDFIETAELDRMKVLAEDNPSMFYHIIPYAYVFGLSDVYAKKLKGLSLPAPEWYTTQRSYSFFDYYLFNRCLMGGLTRTTNTLTMPKPAPPNTSGRSGGSFGGGSFGGGFSGGGFGGGGGGSW